jgi:hypothetical protein
MEDIRIMDINQNVKISWVVILFEHTNFGLQYFTDLLLAYVNY